MNKELKFKTFKYFLECYFNISVNYDELEENINDFKQYENIEYHNKLLAEIERIIDLEDWDFVQGFVKKYGMRNMNEKKLKWLIKVIADNLENH